MTDDVIAMLFDENGNALCSFEYTADELERRARLLREHDGELTTVTIGCSPFLLNSGNTA